VLPLSFGELLDTYYAAHPTARSSGSFKKWRQWFQLDTLSAWEVTPERLAAGAKYLREVKKFAPSTVNRELSQLGSVYKWMIEEVKGSPEGFVSPTLGASGRVKEKLRKVEPPKPGEWERIRLLARGFKDPLFTAFVWLVMDTGARRGEISNRHWTHLHLDDAEGPNIVLWHDQTKTENPRRLYFSRETAALLKRLRPRAETQRDQLIFKSPRGVAPNLYRKSWARLIKLVGREGLHLHDVRHLLAADLLKAGKGLSPVASLLGHSSLILHRRYGHLDDKAIRDIQSERLGLDTPPAPEFEFEPVREARERHAAAQAAAATAPMAEAHRMALLAQDAAAAAEAAATALAAAQAAMRVAMQSTPATPRAT
jgi:integrase